MSGWTDDAERHRADLRHRRARSGFFHGFITTPATIGFVNATVAGVLAASPSCQVWSISMDSVVPVASGGARLPRCHRGPGRLPLAQLGRYAAGNGTPLPAARAGIRPRDASATRLNRAIRRRLQARPSGTLDSRVPIAIIRAPWQSSAITTRCWASPAMPRRGDQALVSQSAQRHHPDVDSIRGGRGALQGAERGVPRPVGPAAAHRLRHVRARRSGRREQRGRCDGFGGGFGPFGDIFDAFFGGSPAGGRGRRRVMAGADLRYDLTIEFAEAVFGVTQRSPSRRWSAARSATGPARNRAASRRSAPSATAPGRSGAWRRRSWARW